MADEKDPPPPPGGPLPAAPYMEALRQIMLNPYAHERTKFENIGQLITKYDADKGAPPKKEE